MFSHVARELGAHPCIGSRASDLAGELQEVGVARVIAATAVESEVPISTETMCRSSKRKEPNGPCLSPPCLRATQSRCVPVITFTPQSRSEKQVDLPPDPTSHRTRKGAS
jgi:hypothetical protein